MFATIPDQIRSNNLRNGNKVAIIEYSGNLRRTLTYGQLYHAALRLSRRLCPTDENAEGARVAIFAGNVLEIHVFYLACAIRGCVAVPINITFMPREIAEVLDSVAPISFFCEGRFSELCTRALKICEISTLTSCSVLPTCEMLLKENALFEDVEDAFPKSQTNTLERLQRPWAILHTSGTTSGKKKGVVRNQSGTIAGIFVHQAALQLSEMDVFLAVWPSYGISSFFFVFGLLYLNARAVLVDPDTASDSTKSWDILLEEGVTFTTGSPLHFENWSRTARRLPSDRLRVALLSGANTSAQNKLVLADSFGERCTLCEAYGSTECGVITISTDLAKEGVGTEPPGVPRAKLDHDTNEILVSPASPMFMKGYVLADGTVDSYFTSGWFKTGDVGRRDEVGNLHLLGRVDDRIGLPNGHDLYPAEVETVLSQVITDRQVFLSYVNNELVGVVTGQYSSQVADTLREHAKANLAPIKRPARYVFLTTLPLTSTNKVKRKDLATMISKL